MRAFDQALSLWLKMYVERWRFLPATRTHSLGHDAPRNSRPTPEYMETVVVAFLWVEMSARSTGPRHMHMATHEIHADHS
jgi:hypothetical protein